MHQHRYYQTSGCYAAWMTMKLMTVRCASWGKIDPNEYPKRNLMFCFSHLSSALLPPAQLTETQSAQSPWTWSGLCWASKCWAWHPDKGTKGQHWRDDRCISIQWWPNQPAWRMILFLTLQVEQSETDSVGRSVARETPQLYGVVGPQRNWVNQQIPRQILHDSANFMISNPTLQ